jgi:hypothetical protein
MCTLANISFMLRLFVSGGLFWILLTYFAGVGVAIMVFLVLVVIMFVLWVEEI